MAMNKEMEFVTLTPNEQFEESSIPTHMHMLCICM